MAIKQLSEEQVQTWTLEQKDRWWLENVFRGNMPQLTLRSALTGFIIGGLLSATNLYIGAKTGWSLGVGITSVIVAFAMYRALAKVGVREFTILENNCMQSIATAAGYMTAPMTSSLTAYMLVHPERGLLPWHTMMIWIIVLSILGVLFAFPLKRRFINDEQHPFPEGRACGVVLDTLHTNEGGVGLVKAKVLAVAALLAAFVKFIQAEAIQEFLQLRVGKYFGLHSAAHKQIDALRTTLDGMSDKTSQAAVQLAAQIKVMYGDLQEKVIHLPEHLENLLVWANVPVPKLFNIDVRSLTIVPVMDIALIAAGGLMGIRAGFSLLLGGVVNFVILVPWMAHMGDIKPRSGVVAEGTAEFTFGGITIWSLWPGVACMVIASFVAFFAKPQLLISSFKGVFGRKTDSDVLKHIEFPLWVSIVGIPIFAVVAALLANIYFEVNFWTCMLGLPLAFVLSMVAANSTALTGTTPVGATSKITQLFYGVVEPGKTGVNLATAGMTAEIVSNSSNLLMDIKPGYMLGAKPRQQAIGHVIGIFSGAIASVPLFFVLFTRNVKPGDPDSIATIQSENFPMPSVTVWKAVAEVLTQGLSTLPTSVLWAVGVFSLLGLFLEVSRIATRNKFPISAVAFGLAFVIPFYSAFPLFLGAFLFWIAGVGRVKEEDPRPKNVFVAHHEPICAGVIAGAAIMGIFDAVIAGFVL